MNFYYFTRAGGMGLFDWWSSSPPQSWAGRIIGGLVMPGLLIWAMAALLAFEDPVGWPRVLGGTWADWGGWANLSLAGIIHFHYFWGAVRGLDGYYHIGRVVGLIALLFSLGCCLWLATVWWFR